MSNKHLLERSGKVLTAWKRKLVNCSFLSVGTFPVYGGRICLVWDSSFTVTYSKGLLSPSEFGERCSKGRP